MPDPLLAVKLKIRRAHEHLHFLQLAIQGFFQREPYNTLSRFDRQTDRYVVSLVVREDPPAEWGPMIGDFVNNLRSALDHLAVALVKRSGGATDRTSFPIFAERPAESQWKASIVGMQPDHITAILAVQPFNNPQPPGLIDTLRWLRELSNQDKHRALTPLVGVLGEGIRCCTVLKIQDCLLGPFESTISTGPVPPHGTEVANAIVTPTGPNPEVDVRVQMSVGVCLNAPPIPPSAGVGEFLVAASTRVVDIVNDFERRFFQ